jgi:hypothetical protein
MSAQQMQKRLAIANADELVVSVGVQGQLNDIQLIRDLPVQKRRQAGVDPLWNYRAYDITMVIMREAREERKRESLSDGACLP